jgi:GT2 family glycosyltransferase/glycosyltransferase involved in cell wall biosynthesis
VENAFSAPMRICLYGAASGAEPDFAHERIDAHDVAEALRLAAEKFSGESLILVRAGVALPPFWRERLTRALALPDVAVASPLDNLDPLRSPLPPDASSDAQPTDVDVACYRHGDRTPLQWPTISPLLSAWNGSALKSIDLESLRDHSLPPTLSPWRAMLVSDLYVADPSKPLRGPRAPKPGEDHVPPSPLGELRERVAASLRVAHAPSYPGLDGRPVVLHVLHGWGGGAERFVRDLASVDTQRHHLVFVARGNFARRRFGESLELLEATLSQPPLRSAPLSDPITSTRTTHRTYKEFLDGILRDFSIDAMFVSSLIGHSLDALRTGLPTIQFIHDFYPMWPLLHRNLDDASLTFDAALMVQDLKSADISFEFAERDPSHWLALREQTADALIAAKATLIAPSHAAMNLFLRLQPRLASLSQKIIPHGTALPQTDVALPLPAPPRREKLRLVVLGRVRGGKAAAMLRDVLPRIRDYAEVFLLGAGSESEEFFGKSGVHILLNYNHADLSQLLARVAPDAAMILPNFGETFSYTLSELIAFGIPVIATKLGALGERIRDGIDGFLMPPDAARIAELIVQLRTHRDRLDTVRATLAQTPHRSLEAMAAEYSPFLPAKHLREDIGFGETHIDRIVTQARAGEIGVLQRTIDALRHTIAEQHKELTRRGEWGFDLDTQLKGAGKSIRTLQIDLDERTQWALRLDSELTSIYAERDALLRSTSWRITAPMRYFVRRAQSLRTRLRYSAARLKAIVHRTRGSLASRGLSGTIKRAIDEFRRYEMPIAVPLVPEPSEHFAPFAVPASDTPRVSIVIPVFNKIAYTAACLRSLVEHAEGIAFETIVVNDCSTDATAQRLAQIDGIRIHRNAQNLGFVGSCNAGAAMARGEFIVFLNNDAVVTAGWLRALLDCFAQEPDAGLVGSKLVYPDGRLQEAGGIVFSDGSGWNYGRFGDPSDPRYNVRRDADYCSGAAIMLPRALFEKLGGFDTRYAPAYYEDTDLAFAVRDSGKKVLVEPRSCVVHFEGVTAGTDVASGMKRYQVVNREKFVEKWKTALARQPAPIHEAKLADRAAHWRDRGHVLIIDAYTPTPDQDSGSLRMLNLMRLLREDGYAVSFLPDNRAHAGDYTRAVQDLGVQALYHPFVSDPIAWLREHGAQLSAVILSRHYVAANYVDGVRLYAPQARLIFDTVDVHHLREQRVADLDGSTELAQQAARTRAQELRLMRACDVTLVVSAAEKEILARDVPQVRIEVVSNVHDVFGRRRDFDERRDLVFVGGFQHPPNVDAVLWFVRDVFPRVRERLGQVTFNVVGSKAPPAILELAHDGVVVHGFVPDIEPFMDGCRLALAPLRYGAGVKGKVNMAMSYGLPVVATLPASEGMHVRDGIDLLVADSPADFAEAIVRGYTDAQLWQTLSDNGLANVRAHFSFDAARAALRRVLDGVTRA